jgi:hypothetical protein
LSSFGRAQDSAWAILEAWGIDPLEKCDGWPKDLVETLAESIYDIGFDMGTRVGKLQEDKRSDSAASSVLQGPEVAAWQAVGHAAGLVMRLPDEHPMEKQEFANAFHLIQFYLMSRPTYREYKRLSGFDPNERGESEQAECAGSDQPTE